MTDTDPQQMFGAGKIGMYYGGSWESVALKAIPYALKNVDVVPIPQGKIRKTVSNGLGNVIFAKTKYPREAWAFSVETLVAGLHTQVRRARRR